PMTVAPTSASPRTKLRCVGGKDGSTNTTFTLGMLPSNVLPMVVAAFVAPFLLPATALFVLPAAKLPGVSLAVITTESADRLSPDLKEHLDGNWQGDDSLDAQRMVESAPRP